MTIYEVFANNLREECGRFDSIAAVCLKSGINRQQFNKYLAGQALPNANTLRKICSLFEIDETKLFENRADKNNGGTKSKIKMSPMGMISQNQSEMISILLARLGVTSESKELITDLSHFDGYYGVYFPLMGSKHHVVSSLLRIKTRDGVTYFTRHTFLKSSRNPKTMIAAGKHSGIVMANQKDYYLLGINRIETNQISFLVFDRQQLASSIFHIGLSVIYGFTTPVACRICVEPIGNSLNRVKQFISRLGVLSILDPSVHPIIAKVVSTASDESGYLMNNTVLNSFID